jgi:hypothetical protein
VLGFLGSAIVVVILLAVLSLLTACAEVIQGLYVFDCLITGADMYCKPQEYKARQEALRAPGPYVPLYPDGYVPSTTQIVTIPPNRALLCSSLPGGSFCTEPFPPSNFAPPTPPPIPPRDEGWQPSYRPHW